MHVSRILICSAAFAATAALAVETKTWIHSEAQEFDKGTLKGLAIASNGRISLAPKLSQRLDGGTAQLWSAAAGAGGRVYAGGSEGKVFVLEADGKSRVLAKLEGGGTVYALLAAPDGVYAATSPDGKIWRVGEDGKTALLHAAKAHYVWALVAGEGGVLYAATGDPGQILKIQPGGQATVLYDAGETHVRSLASDAHGNLIAGTDASGVVLRVNANSEGFVLHQTGKREVTAIAVAKDGTIFAAATGNRAATPAPAPAPTPVPLPAPAQPVAAGAQQPQPATPAPTRPAALPPTLGAVSGPSGGSEIWRIGTDGEPTLYWSDAHAVVYALAFDSMGRLLAGTGNQGRIYRIETAQSYTRIAHAEASQITALAVLPGGGIAATSANPGRLYQLGPETERTGTLESDVLDAASFAYWGRLRWEGELNGGGLKIETRSGNLDAPEKDWSAWQGVNPATGSRVASPAARFLQWRATLTAAPGGSSPELKLVEAAYQQKNVAPVIEKIEITPFNHKFPAPSSLSISASTTLSLPPIGQVKRTGASTPLSEPSGSTSMNYDKGWIGARWKASDQNGDTLEFKIEYRGVEEREWKLLKEHVKENRFSWDTTSFADGRYRLRVTASDLPDNYDSVALTAAAESEPFVINNTPPQIENLTAKPEGGKLVIRFHASDALSELDSAEYSINGSEWKAARPTTGMTDSLAHDYVVEAELPKLSEWTVAVKATDENDNVAVRKITLRP
jgi:hypothetical protein